MNEEQLGTIEKLYWGMNLNQTYPNTEKRLARRGYKVGTAKTPDINPFNEIELQKMSSSLQIRLNL